MQKFKCLRIYENNGKIEQKIEQKNLSDLPQNEILINVKFASLNYKDALSANGNKGVTKNYPHTPGIDAAGIIIKSKGKKFTEGQEVLVTGYDLGMNTWGSLSEYISVPEEWIVPIPKGLNLKETMMLGTAGFTAAIAIFKMLRNSQTPAQGEIVITGASGGVGSLSINILSKLGFNVVAATGKQNQHEFLMKIGASRCIDRKELLTQPNKPLAKPIWAGGIDNLGGEYLEGIIKSTNKEGNIVSIGLAASPKLNLTVLPFILNGVNLLGVNSADYIYNQRLLIWEKLANEWKPIMLKNIVKEITLENSINYLNDIFNGNSLGRLLVII